MHRLATAAMGTRFELVLDAGPGADFVAAGEAALAEICACHERLSRFASDSLVSHIARTPTATPVRLDGDTYRLFVDALDVWRASDGAFDVTVGPLMAAHGFAPSAVSVARRAGAEAIVLDDEHWTVAFHRDSVGLDFGAIAKGHALDLAGAILRDAGVTSALLHGGTSSVLAIGAPEATDGWRVAVQFGTSRPAIALKDTALSVSNPSSQVERSRGHHILDPRSGAPVARRAPVAVTGPSARLCDAWSTALAVLGSAPPGFPAGYTSIFESEAR